MLQLNSISAPTVFLSITVCVYYMYMYPAAEPGCSQCHRGITIGDWRDPLDPELDAQVIFSQFNQGKAALQKKYLPGE